MGRGVSEQDGSIPADASLAGSGSAVGHTRNASEGEVRLHREMNLNPQPQSAGVTSDAAIGASIPKATPAACSAPTCDPLRPSQNPPEVRLRKTSRREARGQEVKVQREDPLPPELSLRHSLTTFSEVSVVTTHTQSQHPEPKHKAVSPSDNTGCGVKRYCEVTGGGPMSSGLLLISPGATRPSKPESPRQKVRTSEVRDGSSPRKPAGQTRAAQLPASTPSPTPKATPEVEPQAGKPGGGSSAQSSAVSPPFWSNTRETRPGGAGGRVMSDHPWKPLILAAYPRPEGSRSNYGAVERILRSYGENAAWTKQNQAASAPNLSPKPPPPPQDEDEEEEEEEEEEEGIDLPEMPMMMDTDVLPLSPVSRHTHTYSHASHTSHTRTTTYGSSVGVKEIPLNIQDGRTSAVPLLASPPSPRPPRRNFPRPARPANRRRPSRWAGPLSPLSSSSSSSSSSSPFIAPVAPMPPAPLSRLQKRHPPTFVFSHAFHMETVII
ncbi:hypothetical protein CRUP_008079 [Coryphaenoides rupestris]|nr:hypothetical protein CRUP_008079 [Coryphaenoides rupestris]